MSYLVVNPPACLKVPLLGAGAGRGVENDLLLLNPPPNPPVRDPPLKLRPPPLNPLPPLANVFGAMSKAPSRTRTSDACKYRRIILTP